MNAIQTIGIAVVFLAIAVFVTVNITQNNNSPQTQLVDAVITQTPKADNIETLDITLGDGKGQF